MSEKNTLLKGNLFNSFLTKAHKKYLIFLSLPVLITGILIGYFLPSNILGRSSDTNLTSKEIRLGEYKLINPLLECEQSLNLDFAEYKPSKKKVESLINEKMESKTISYASIYYRDLNNGPWFGINEKENFSPASLLKLPVMIAYFNQAESDPTLLQKKLMFKKGQIPETKQDINRQGFIEPDKFYTIDELIYKMIVNSDNYALFLLSDNMNDNQIYKVFSDLGIETAKGDSNQDYMSVKSYATLLRVLFNASYLNSAMSEKGLEILSKTDTTGGIPKGIPKNIIIAHKYGERDADAKGTKQLHDCGIIYYPSHPYLLCVMTRGTDFNNLADTIAEISSLVYTDINQRYQK